ncbi:MAG: hypothetical protein LBJ16_03195 [Holosporaceae bacterium]|nr:hypothetical protein [Holosporaceae bacterium]
MPMENMLIARICHDLITPFNAINLGLEAFEMSSDMSLIDNIKASVNKANNVLKFNRELFSAKADTFCYSTNSIEQIVSDVLRSHNIVFDLESDIDNVPSIAGKIIMYTAIIAKEIMPFGGTVMTRVNDSSGEIVTKCNGKGIAVPFMPTGGELTYRNVIRYSLLELLKRSDFELSITNEGNDIVISEKII